MKVPPQYNRLMPYLIIPHAHQFVEFMKNIFSATEQVSIPRSEGIIMHGELRIGESVIMFADVTEQFAARPAGMFIYVENLNDVFQKAIAAGAIATMQPTRMDYGYSCGFKDPFGNDWWPCEAEK